MVQDKTVPSSLEIVESNQKFPFGELRRTRRRRKIIQVVGNHVRNNV
jgi:hypothetical protein